MVLALEHIACSGNERIQRDADRAFGEVIMKQVFALFLSAAVATSASGETPKYSAESFYKTIDYSVASVEGSFSPDGKRLLITSNATGVFNAYTLDVKTNEQTALTNSTTNSITAVSYFPDGPRFLYTFDQGGNELNHVVVGGTGGEHVDLTPGENLRASFVGWIEDGGAFVLQTNERDRNCFDLYRYDAQDYSRRMIFQNDGALDGFTTSPDGAWAAAIMPESSGNNDIYLISLAQGGAQELVTPHSGKVFHNVYTFTPDSSALVYGTDQHGEFTQAWMHILDTGEKKLVIAENWDVAYVTFSDSGRYRVSAINNDGAVDVTILDLRTGKAVRLPEDLPIGDLQGVRFSPDEKTVAFLINSDVSPSNVFTVKLGKNKFRQHTEALNPEIDQENLVANEVVRYKSFDGVEIPAVLYRPKDASADNRVPALVWVHGGPGGQSRTGYSGMLQHLVNHGYAVLAANNRGSSGYGKTFFHMDDKRHGEGDLQDIVYARKYLESLDWVDGEKVGIIGGSYGGFMVLSALAFEPEAFDVGINIFGVSNWLRTLSNTPAWWGARRKTLFDELGDPSTDAERLRRISPLFHAKNIVKPLLVVQGARDPRVLQVESDEIVAAVERNGVPVEYIVFPDEGHGIRNRHNRITASEAYVRFLDRHFRSQEPAVGN
jgi:dipeptidyl aminopeptidase/acylaminoacyl peptidase